MSRSYRKFPSSPSSEYDPPSWVTFRVKELQCVCKEIHNVEYGEVIFPKPKRAAQYSWSSHHRYYYPMKRIRDNYTTEIRNILNGYSDRWERPEDFETAFIDCYTQIRNCDSGRLSLCFEWLDTKEAKKAIKDWNGEPLEVLAYLNHHRIIERAVKLEQRRMVRK